MSFKKYFVLLFFLFSVYLTNAQQNNNDKLSLNLDKALFTDVIGVIESKTDYFFYYRKKDVDTLKVTLQITNASVPTLLEQLFANIDLHYAIDSLHHVFITRTVAINTTLAQDTNEEMHQGKAINDSPEIHVIATGNSRGNKVYEIGNKNKYKPGSTLTLSGIIKNNKGIPLSEASVLVNKLQIKSSTNSSGQYSITLPAGRHEITVRYLGMVNKKENIILYGSGILDIEMQEEVTNLDEILIKADGLSSEKSVTLGTERLNINQIKYIPTVFGEADVLRAVLTLPGVKSVGEASTGFNVRGGAPDQNLILFNDATIYNPSHFFGFFSAFNPETISGVELYKSSIPAKYGGRLSSVLQITGKEGNQEKIKGSAGIGLVTSRFNIEGPLAKGKTTFLAGVRTTYSNWLFKLLPQNSGYRNSKAAFTDVSLNVTHHFNSTNSLSLTGYLSNDESNLSTDTVFRYSNKNLSLKWQHDFNNNLTSSVTLGTDYYDYSNHFDRDTVSAYNLHFAIDQKNLKVNFDYTPGTKHVLDFGIHSINYNIQPGTLSKGEASSLIQPVTIQKEHALETAVYIEDQYKIGEHLSVNAGLRYSLFNYLGAQDINAYNSSVPKTETNSTDTITYKKGDIIKTYHGLDLRMSARYGITNDFSIKAGFTTTRQFIHMLTNTVAISPTDIWKLSDTNIKPQYSQQISLGLYKTFSSNLFEASVEGYIKRIKNYLDYKSGAKLLANDHIETEVFTTKGKAYGIEAMIRKPTGNFNGWMSYTYSRTLLKVDDPQAGETINKGNFYPANYDKPHDFTFVGNQKLSRRFSISMNMTYSTGRPVTIPIGIFYYGHQQKTLYADRNSYRIPNYFRTDLSFNIEGNHKIKQLTHSSWTVGLYNLTGRKNPYSIYFTSENGIVKGYKLSIFGSIIPFVNYNIRF